jgi:hypothetical protein
MKFHHLLQNVLKTFSANIWFHKGVKLYRTHTLKSFFRAPTCQIENKQDWSWCCHALLNHVRYYCTKHNHPRNRIQSHESNNQHKTQIFATWTILQSTISFMQAGSTIFKASGPAIICVQYISTEVTYYVCRKQIRACTAQTNLHLVHTNQSTRNPDPLLWPDQYPLCICFELAVLHRPTTSLYTTIYKDFKQILNLKHYY